MWSKYGWHQDCFKMFLACAEMQGAMSPDSVWLLKCVFECYWVGLLSDFIKLWWVSRSGRGGSRLELYTHVWASKGRSLTLQPTDIEKFFFFFFNSSLQYKGFGTVQSQWFVIVICKRNVRSYNNPWCFTFIHTVTLCLIFARILYSFSNAVNVWMVKRKKGRKEIHTGRPQHEMLLNYWTEPFTAGFHPQVDKLL